MFAPTGWGESAAAAPEAQRRASRWQDALGLRLAQVISAPANDRFAETIAVFERSEPVPEDAFASEAAAVTELANAVANVVGTEAPEQSELRSTQSGEQLIWAQWIVDDISYECVLTPSGETATISGTPGNDKLSGTNGDDVIAGGRGNDRIKAKGGDDIVCGDDGNDKVSGGGGEDRVKGGGGEDRVKGGGGDDRLNGGGGDDSVKGGGGRDRCSGGGGDDEVDCER